MQPTQGPRIYKTTKLQENEITDLFLVSAGCETIRKISIMVCPKELEDLTFSEILDMMKKICDKKKKCWFCRGDKVSYKQTRVKQNDNNSIYTSYKRLSYFEKLGTGEVTIEYELIKLRLIEDMSEALYKH